MQELIDAGYDLLKRERSEDALKLFDKAIEMKPDHSYTYYLAALANFEMENFQNSLKYIKKAILIDPEVPGYYIIRGRTFV